MSLREMRRIALAENVERVSRQWLMPKAANWFAAHPDELQLFQWTVKAHQHG